MDLVENLSTPRYLTLLEYLWLRQNVSTRCGRFQDPKAWVAGTGTGTGTARLFRLPPEWYE
jgi:hypothetical protein